MDSYKEISYSRRKDGWNGGLYKMFKPKDRQKKEIVKTHTEHSSNACMVYMVWNSRWRKQKEWGRTIFKIRAEKIPKLMDIINAQNQEDLQSQARNM